MSSTGKTPDYWLFDDMVGSVVRLPPLKVQATRHRMTDEGLVIEATLDGKCWFKPDGPVMVTGETPREETVMQTYRFEIVVPRVTDDVTGKETKPAALIAKGEGLLEEPNAADLLQDAGEALTKAGRKASEASVNIRPFCG